jgi:phosphate transport system substrate-binding protein
LLSIELVPHIHAAIPRSGNQAHIQESNMRMKSGLFGLVLSGLAISAVGAQPANEVNGAGASFPYPIYAKWAAAYHQETGVKINYQSIGSGGGIRQISRKTVDFGASDAPLKKDELDAAGLIQFPMIIGGVVPVVNVQGIKPGELKLTGEQLADIYLGKIKKWNDPVLTRNNPGVKLPDQNITIVHRSDGSGTTWTFTNYLSKVSQNWADTVGNNSAVKWPGGVGGKGNEGVASYVTRISGGIGYVEYAYALQNKLAHSQLQNREGHYVSPSIQSFQASAADADWDNAPGFYMVLTDQPGADSWPISAASFILMQREQAKPAVAQAALEFFDWAYRNGAGMATELDYVPIPESVSNIVRKHWAEALRQPDGQAVWTR